MAGEVCMRRTMVWMAAAMAGCSGSSGQAALDLALTPDPIQEAPCPASHCGTLTGQLEAAGSLRIQEIGGASAEITALEMTLVASGATVASGTFDAQAITSEAGTNRVAANGQLTVPVSVHFDQVSGGRAGTFMVVVSATGAGGHTLSKSASVPVQP
jgi:hypothetical protein